MRMPKLGNLFKAITSEGQNHCLLYDTGISLYAQQLTIASTQGAFEYLRDEQMLSSFPLRPDWSYITVLSLTSCLTLGELVTSLHLCFLICNMGLIIGFIGLLWGVRKLQKLMHVKGSTIPGMEETLIKCWALLFMCYTSTHQTISSCKSTLTIVFHSWHCPEHDRHIILNIILA